MDGSPIKLLFNWVVKKYFYYKIQDRHLVTDRSELNTFLYATLRKAVIVNVQLCQQFHRQQYYSIEM